MHGLWVQGGGQHSHDGVPRVPGLEGAQGHQGGFKPGGVLQASDGQENKVGGWWWEVILSNQGGWYTLQFSNTRSPGRGLSSAMDLSTCNYVLI